MGRRCAFLTGAIAVAIASSLLSGCDRAIVPGETTAIGDDAITVASFDFPESRVLAEIYAQALEGRGFRVERALGIGPRELVEPALQRGLVELVPEYAGSALTFIGRSASSDGDLTHQRLVDALGSRGLTALSPAPAQDRNAFAVLTSTAEELDVRTLSDLVPYADDIVFGGPTECEQRDLCLLGLGRVYGLRFKEFVPLDAGGPITLQALLGGTIGVGLLFTSDPAIDGRDLIELVDDRGMQPAENVTPVVSRSTLDRFGPALADLVNAVSALIRTSDLRRMNAALAAGRSPFGVARAWLLSRGFTVASG
jgi:osmoprotectant transport system substrate-binding protein